MRTKKFLAILSSAAVMSAAFVKAQPSDSTASDMTGQKKSARMSPETEAQVRAELRRTIDAMNSPNGAPNTGLSPEQKARLVEQLRQTIAKMNAEEQAVFFKSNLTPEQQAQVEETLHQAEADLAAKERAAAEAKKKKKEVAVVASVPAPAPAPAPAAPPSKEQRLADLLVQYKADKITPAEYHEQRAKIIAEH